MSNGAMVSMTRHKESWGFAKMVAMASQRILVVDDEEDLLELIRYNLGKEGYQVRCVSTGEGGIQEAKIYSPDLILLDLMLPAVDGLGVCKLLKSDPQMANIPIV